MIKQILSLSIRHRRTVVALGLAAAIIGAWSLARLPIDAVPDITNKQIQINTVAPALSPAELEKLVAFRIEIALAGIPGLESTRSLSRNGFAQVTAVFTEQTDIYFARQQVSERLLALRPTLPAGAEPSMGPVSTGLGEIYMWSVKFSDEVQKANSFTTAEGEVLTTDIARAAYLRTVQDWIIKPKIKTVPGVAGVDSIGGYVKQFHVHPEPDKLIAFGLTFADITKAIQSNNVSRGASVIAHNGEGISVRSIGRLRSLTELADVVVGTRGAVPLRVRDVAEVDIGGEIRTGSASTNGRETVIGTALMLIGANSRTVASAVDARLNEIQATLPPGIEVQTILNRTQLVDATIATVASNLAEGALLVVAVLFLLLGNLRAALITALVIPVTMLMTAAGMFHGHISANLMSLGALDFGLIVDGTVIITENALRRLAERQVQLGRILETSERLQTIELAAAEVIGPTVYGQAIIILVYVPLLTFSGVEGKMFEPMALTVILALASAFVLSLTMVPAMIAIFINERLQEHDNAFVRPLKRLYTPALKFSLRRPVWPMVCGALLFGAAVLVFMRLGQDFIPSLDEKNLAVHAVRIPSTSLEQSQSMQLEIEKTISALPQVAFVFSKTGTAEIASDPMPPNASDTFVIFKPRAQWPNPRLTGDALRKQIEAAMDELPGNAYEFTQPIQMRFNELLAGVRGDLAIKVFGDEFGPMLRAANRIADILRSVDGAADVKVEQIEGLSTLDINVDKQAIARRGLSLATVQDTIGAAVGGEEAGVVFEGDRMFNIVVRLPETTREDVEAMKRLPVLLPGSAVPGHSMPLGDVAKFEFSETPNQISREDGKRRIVVTANVRDRDIASVVGDVRRGIEARLKLPPGYWLNWGGQYQNLEMAKQRLLIIVPVCFAAIFFLLVRALGSARDALIAFSAVPLALTGGVFTLYLRGLPFSISAAVGFIALSGIAVLNGLVMLTFIKQLIRDGQDKSGAIYRGALVRLRPVAMTALVASLGFIPMALATGTGAEVQRPIATVVVGGLVSATLLTLFVLPALYMMFGGTGRVMTRHKHSPNDR